ncbi:hypothetical protein GTC6_02170 [Gordonia terrae C-6]|uniref:Uncharacterized protein n=1 Tax=Gordonia terrae C-6 TaxID=1316928 RepID=R7YEA2_9ACTN|nr:hypothetical protein [Gordonia terrae]EON34375.1 hypothetical protein GTC6_02170 [Gordonia terrae C-6]
MPLDDLVGRWTERLSHIDSILDPLITQWPGDDRVAVRSMLSGMQHALNGYLAAALAESTEGEVGAIVAPAVSELRGFCTLKSLAGGREFLERITALRDTARAVSLALSTEEELRVQTVEEIIADFAEEYRMSLILALTANYALSQKVMAWQEAKDKDPAVGDNLDLTTMKFVGSTSNYTIPMSSLTSASTATPTVITPANIGAAMREMMTGGTPPPIYRMAYTQWFTTVHAAWEDTYRARLAAAHGLDDDGKPWGKNDVRSAFFNEVRLIRNDISHKNGICVDSADNAVITWVRRGEAISPTPRDMLGMLDLFPAEELRRAPKRAERTTAQLPYQFDNEWLAQFNAHVTAVEPAKKKRAAAVQKVLDEWMGTATNE